MRSLNGCR